VPEQLRVIAARLLQGVGQDGQAVEGLVAVDGGGQVGDEAVIVGEPFVHGAAAGDAALPKADAAGVPGVGVDAGAGDAA
jgi:hypothetical protein